MLRWTTALVALTLVGCAPAEFDRATAPTPDAGWGPPPAPPYEDAPPAPPYEVASPEQAPEPAPEAEPAPSPDTPPEAPPEPEAAPEADPAPDPAPQADPEAEDPAEPAPAPSLPPEPEPEPDPEPEPEPEPPAAPPPCSYPHVDGPLRPGATMPRLSWRGAGGPGGQAVDFDLETFHCDPAFDGYHALVVFVGAEWCGACGQYLGQLRGQVGAVDAAGGLFLFVETEDNGGQPASHRTAIRTIDRRLGADAPGIRVGDGETLQGARSIHNAPIVQSFPTVFVVRRSDMRVVAEGLAAWQVLDTVQGLR